METEQNTIFNRDKYLKECSERMKKLLLAFKMSPEQFAMTLDNPRGDVIRNVIDMKNRNGISNNLVFKIIQVHENVNPEWLLEGKGNMFLTDDQIISQTGKRDISQSSSCLLCKEKERYIKSLEERVLELKRTIEIQEKCLEMLKILGEGTSHDATSG